MPVFPLKTACIHGSFSPTVLKLHNTGCKIKSPLLKNVWNFELVFYFFLHLLKCYPVSSQWIKENWGKLAVIRKVMPALIFPMQWVQRNGRTTGGAAGPAGGGTGGNEFTKPQPGSYQSAFLSRGGCPASDLHSQGTWVVWESNFQGQEKFRCESELRWKYCVFFTNQN